jgi:hypothetical protein
VSFSAHRRDALDPSLPIAHRLSHVRSCAMLMGQKYKVRRSVILDLVKHSCGADLMGQVSESEIVEAIRLLDRIKADGPAAVSNGRSGSEVSMAQWLAATVGEAERHGLFGREEVQARLSALPQWLARLQEPGGLDEFASRLGITIPGAIRECWGLPELVCLLDASRIEDTLGEEPHVIVWKGVSHLWVCWHPHSGTSTGAVLRAGDDPPLNYGYEEGEEDETPIGPVAERFSDFVSRMVGACVNGKLYGYARPTWKPGW